MLAFADTLPPQSGDTHFRQIPLERQHLVGPDNGADIPVRPDQRPLARRQAISVAEMAAIIHQIAAQADDMDAQPKSWGNGITIGFAAEQCTVRTTEQRKQTGRLA